MVGVIVSAITFQSKDHLVEAFSPLKVEEVEERVLSRGGLDVDFDASLKDEKVIPARNLELGSLVETELYVGERLTVYYPERPRVPHHLVVAMNRKVCGISDLRAEECQELFETLRKIAEIYKMIGIHGFVVAQYDKPQIGHQGRYVVEVIPHLPGFERVKNIVDKVECNRHVLYRSANISPITYPFHEGELEEGKAFWQQAFSMQVPSLDATDFEVSYPFDRRESHQKEAEAILKEHLIEMLEDKGGRITEPRFFNFTMPTKLSSEGKTVTVAKCFFCDAEVIKRQKVFEYENILVFYNIRKGAKPGCNFLVLPKRHTQKVYGLTADEIENIRVVRGALAEVLKETHPECEVVVYVQDDPSIGQTVFHSHEQVVAIDPKTVSLTWTLMSLYPEGSVSHKEMEQIKEVYSQKLWDKIQGLSLQKAE